MKRFNYSLTVGIFLLQVIIGQGCYRENVYDLHFGTHAFHCESMQIAVGVGAGVLFVMAVTIVVYITVRRWPRRQAPKPVGIVTFTARVPVHQPSSPASTYLNYQQQQV